MESCNEDETQSANLDRVTRELKRSEIKNTPKLELAHEPAASQASRAVALTVTHALVLNLVVGGWKFGTDVSVVLVLVVAFVFAFTFAG